MIHKANEHSNTSSTWYQVSLIVDLISENANFACSSLLPDRWLSSKLREFPSVRHIDRSVVVLENLLVVCIFFIHHHTIVRQIIFIFRNNLIHIFNQIFVKYWLRWFNRSTYFFENFDTILKFLIKRVISKKKFSLNCNCVQLVALIDRNQFWAQSNRFTNRNHFSNFSMKK